MSHKTEVFQALIDRDGPNCWLCEMPIRGSLVSGSQKPWSVTLDHVVEKRNGGTDKLHNLKLAHRQCNTLRTLLFSSTEGGASPSEDERAAARRLFMFDDRARDFLNKLSRLEHTRAKTFSRGAFLDFARYSGVPKDVARVLWDIRHHQDAHRIARQDKAQIILESNAEANAPVRLIDEVEPRALI